jgi:hypothetical protein
MAVVGRAFDISALTAGNSGSTVTSRNTATHIRRTPRRRVTPGEHRRLIDCESLARRALTPIDAAGQVASCIVAGRGRPPPRATFRAHVPSSGIVASSDVSPSGWALDPHPPAEGLDPVCEPDDISPYQHRHRAIRVRDLRRSDPDVDPSQESPVPVLIWGSGSVGVGRRGVGHPANRRRRLDAV